MISNTHFIACEGRTYFHQIARAWGGFVLVILDGDTGAIAWQSGPFASAVEAERCGQNLLG
jgi:hypothetical protein